MYARNYTEAKEYLMNNHSEAIIREITSNCSCGESLALVAEDEDGNELEEVIVCDACWQNASFHDRADSPATVSEEDLADIISEYYSIAAIEVEQRWMLDNDGNDLIKATLEMADDETKEVYLITTADNSVYITFDEVTDITTIKDTEWHSIGSDADVVIVKGLPRCADEPLTTRLAISDRIHRERIAQHLSIGQLAAKAGLSKNHIWRIESGDYRYTIDILAAVCKALGLKITVE